MTLVTEKRCDRCNRVIGALEPHISLTVSYHHPRKLDICRECEGEFTLWLGKHPLFGTDLEAIIAGRASGSGYPTAEQIDRHRRVTHDYEYEPMELPCPHRVPCAWPCQPEVYRRVPR